MIAWFSGTDVLVGETSNTLTFDPAAVGDQGDYHCQTTFPTVGNTVFGGKTTSESATLTVHRTCLLRLCIQLGVFLGRILNS